MPKDQAAIEMERLIESSSLGTPAARAFRSLAPPFVVTQILEHLTDDESTGGDNDLEERLRALGAAIRRNPESVWTGKVTRPSDRARHRPEGPAAARQIDELLELTDTAGDAYRCGRTAADQGDYETAEQYLRPIAEQGHPEAAYWLAVALEARSARLRSEGSSANAEELATEAASWHREAEAAGAFDLELGTPAIHPAPVDEIPPMVLYRIARAHQRAQRLLNEATMLVEEHQDLEAILAAQSTPEDEDGYSQLRESTGLAALDSVLGNAAAVISTPGGGLWCGGAPRPWPTTAWPIDDVD